jgi:hypothetical protein
MLLEVISYTLTIPPSINPLNAAPLIVLGADCTSSLLPPPPPPQPVSDIIADIATSAFSITNPIYRSKKPYFTQNKYMSN